MQLFFLKNFQLDYVTFIQYNELKGKAVIHMDTFGERLKHLRKAADMTQSELSSYLGVVPSAVGKYERYPQAYPSVEVLIKMADFFKVSIDYLLRGTESVSHVENNISSGAMNNSSFIQANHGGIVENAVPAPSPEAAELLKIYDSLGGRDRLKLLNFAVDMVESK